MSIVEGLRPQQFEVPPLVGEKRDQAMQEAQALLTADTFNPMYFSRVIGAVAQLMGGELDKTGYHMLTKPIIDRERERSLTINYDRVPRDQTHTSAVNVLLIQPSWAILPVAERVHARGNEPYTHEYTAITFKYGDSRWDNEQHQMVYPPTEETSVLALHSTLWFPIAKVDRPNYLGGAHFVEGDGNVYNGWASREKTYFPNGEGQRMLAERVYDAWQKQDQRSQGQRELPIK